MYPHHIDMTRDPRAEHVGRMPNFEEAPFFDTIPEGKRAAIVMAHFGTTHADTRTKTIDAINARVREAYPDIEVREAYTSRIILKRLRDRGTPKPNLPETLEALRQEGYTHIIVQPTVIIDGVEMASIRRDVAQHKDLFDDVRVGTPLLFLPLDYYRLVDAMTSGYRADTAYVWVGHGTYDSSTAQYTMISYILRQLGHDNVFVGTIEGFPTSDDAMSEVKASGLKRVCLVPLMFVAGEHAKNDIAEDWREQYEDAGFEVSVSLEGMGERAAVQTLYLDKLDQTVKYHRWDIMRKKKIYEVTGEKMAE